MNRCPFCEIVAGRAPANIVHAWNDVIAFVPRRHVTDAASSDIETVMRTMRCATALIRSWDHAANLITSVGEAATQSVFHLHVHAVPRRLGDGLPLPWTPQQEAAAGSATPEEDTDGS
jgi:histidine triad (HIT) family protein